MSTASLRSRRARPILVVTAIAALLGAMSGGAAELAYTVTDLGTLGGRRTVALAINGAGQATGFSETADRKTRAFLYDAGSMEDLGTFGGRDSLGYDISDIGTVVGRAQDRSGAFRAFVTSRGGSLLDLTRLNRAFEAPFSTATGVNARGEVVGYRQAGTEHAAARTRAFLFSDSALIDLGAFRGEDAVVSAVNDLGQFVGFYSTEPHADYSSYRAFRGQQGMEAVDLGSLGGPVTTPTAINRAGQIAGFGQTKNGEPRAFVYQAGSLTALGTLPGGRQSFAYGLNALGHVVGASDASSGGLRAVLYSGAEVIDLNGTIPAGSGWTLTEARDINDSGAIVGTGVFRGQQRGFLLQPVSSR